MQSKMMAKFSKGEDLKYCSHLDLQKLFMRSIARANIPVRFSQGFNKHPLISMAMALSVGVESMGEYIDIELENEMEPAEFIDRMNCALPRQLRILDAKTVSDKRPALMAQVELATYKFIFENTECVDIEKISNEILNKKEIIIDKKTKSKTEKTDIKPMIFSINFYDNIVEATLSCGQTNLKPFDFLKLYGENLSVRIIRTHIFTKKGDTPVELMSI